MKIRLKKAFYRLKQALRAWYNRVDKYFQNNNFTKCSYEHALYAKANRKQDILIVCLHVDDLILTRNNPKMFEEFKRTMTKEFEMMDIGLMSYYLGIEVKQCKERIFISQEGYVKEVLKKFNIGQCKPVSTLIEYGINLSKIDEGEKVNPTTFKSYIKSLRYLTCTRPNILYEVGLIIDFGLLYLSFNNFKFCWL